jgi:hypothetical protein
MEHIHVTAVNLIFSVHLAETERAQMLAARKFRFYFFIIKIVIPRNGVVRTENIFFVSVVRVGRRASDMVSRKIKKVERDFCRNNLWDFDNV